MCPHCHKNTEKLKTVEIEGFTITKPKVCETYKEAKKCPKGFRLPKRWELFKIFEKMENRKKLTDGGYMFLWSDSVEDDYVKGLCLYRYLIVGSYIDILASSNDSGRVVWIKEEKKA